MESVLSFESVSFSYHSVKGETPAVANLSFSVQQGEFTVLVGPSGCGKGTVVLRIQFRKCCHTQNNISNGPGTVLKHHIPFTFSG